MLNQPWQLRISSLKLDNHSNKARLDCWENARRGTCTEDLPDRLRLRPRSLLSNSPLQLKPSISNDVQISHNSDFNDWGGELYITGTESALNSPCCDEQQPCLSCASTNSDLSSLSNTRAACSLSCKLPSSITTPDFQQQLHHIDPLMNSNGTQGLLPLAVVERFEFKHGDPGIDGWEKALSDADGSGKGTEGQIALTTPTVLPTTAGHDIRPLLLKLPSVAYPKNPISLTTPSDSLLVGSKYDQDINSWKKENSNINGSDELMAGQESMSNPLCPTDHMGMTEITQDHRLHSMDIDLHSSRRIHDIQHSPTSPLVDPHESLSTTSTYCASNSTITPQSKPSSIENRMENIANSDHNDLGGDERDNLATSTLKSSCRNEDSKPRLPCSVGRSHSSSHLCDILLPASTLDFLDATAHLSLDQPQYLSSTGDLSSLSMDFASTRPLSSGMKNVANSDLNDWGGEECGNPTTGTLNSSCFNEHSKPSLPCSFGRPYPSSPFNFDNPDPSVTSLHPCNVKSSASTPGLSHATTHILCRNHLVLDSDLSCESTAFAPLQPPSTPSAENPLISTRQTRRTEFCAMVDNCVRIRIRKGRLKYFCAGYWMYILAPQLYATSSSLFPLQFLQGFSHFLFAFSTLFNMQITVQHPFSHPWKLLK